MPGELAPLECNVGFSLTPKEASPFLRCQSDGTWSSQGMSQLPSCECELAMCCNPFCCMLELLLLISVFHFSTSCFYSATLW